ncbi:MAG TPA: coproporphyrinogen dehydrogenase HemZ [Candidatus Scatomorpha intestinigallinarum]|uniref:Coproporphyrinogen dehydrogenase HemZ n=1 Tax=Candidatus Scatomorpha intestinigallinarum TaxID=2840923 RepID=A0A9D1DJW2_9FIRM|nr:coproporphyrinogen dehydrogenase HemZ [Candidatus Scatomorpha intestinigallinarum]
MRLYFSGHDCRYAAEQSLLMLFPGEKPEYPEGSPSGERCELRVGRGAKYTVCTALLVRSGAAFRGRAQAENPDPADEYALRGCENRLVKLAFYRAALASGLPRPEWGSLSGVRPAKLMDAYLREGLSPRAAKGRFMREYFVSGSRAQLCLDAALAAQEAARSLDERDVCLYVGIPFCPTRCAYCSFVSQSVEKSMKLMEPFLDALLLDIRATAAETRRAGLRPVALYMGGGTPTTLSAAQLDRLCAALEREFDLSALREYTVEAGRPDTITAEKLRVLRAHGVGRVSVNPQTMSDSVLEAIGRRHTAQDIVDALALVRECGGFEVNMDLIAGLPTDTAGGFSRTLDAVLSLAPENVTVHTLSLKRGSGLTLAGRPLPEAGEVRAMLDEAMERLAGSGYAPYYLYRQKNMAGGFENVGWTKPGSENLYNICIMEELCSILAMGAGGSTKLVADGGKRIKRFIAPKYPQEYINAAPGFAAGKERIGEFYGLQP